MKTIALLVRRLYNGGIERVVSLLIPILNQAGYKTILLTNDPAGKDDYPIPEGTKRFVIPIGGEERQKRLSEILKQERADVLFCHEYSSDTLMDDLNSAKEFGIKTLMTWHSVFSTMIATNDEFFDKKMTAALSVDMMLTLSHTDEYFFKCCGVPAKYVPNPMVFQGLRENPRQMAKKSPVVLFPSRISPEKNPLDAIRIFAEVHKTVPSAIMKIAGADKFPELDMKVTAQIDKQGLNGSVLRLGFCHDMKPLYDEADVMLMTSDYEGFPMTVLEAKANALPVVAYALPYLENMRPETGVLTVKHGDINDGALQIVSLLQNPELYRKNSEDALADAHNFASFDFVHAYQDVFASLETAGEQRRAPHGTLMLQTLHDSIKMMRKSAYNYGYRDGQKNIIAGMTYKIGHLLMWLPVHLKRIFCKEK